MQEDGTVPEFTKLTYYDGSYTFNNVIVNCNFKYM